MIALLLLNGLCFLLILMLGHLELWNQLLYAFLLSMSLCLMAGLLDGVNYVRARRLLEQKKLAGASLLEDREWLEELQDRRDGDSLQADLELLLANIWEGTLERLEEYQRASKEQMDYYVMWTHQIKTPIAALRLLVDGLPDPKLAFRLREECLRMEQYVEMVLCYQRLETMGQDLEVASCKLREMVSEVVKKLSVSFINSAIHLELEDFEDEILTDEKWFAFCVEQLLSNSIKYTAQKKRMTEEFEGEINIHVEGDEGDRWLVIEDNGIGIRAQDLPRVFERGFTGFNGRADKKATGIGLFLTKKILNKMGNQIRLESEVGTYTRVGISLYASQTIKD